MNDRFYEQVIISLDKANRLLTSGTLLPRSALPEGIGKNGPGISVGKSCNLGASLTKRGQLTGSAALGAVGHSVLRAFFLS